jgi:hypothetical protein
MARLPRGLPAGRSLPRTGDAAGGPRVRVSLDLLPTPAARVAGTLTSERDDAPIPFDGWLDLMRLLEAIAGEPLAPTDSTSTDDARGPPSAT